MAGQMHERDDVTIADITYLSSKDRLVERLKASLAGGPKSGPYQVSVSTAELENHFSIGRQSLGKLIKTLFPEAVLKRRRDGTSLYMGLRLKDGTGLGVSTQGVNRQPEDMNSLREQLRQAYAVIHQQQKELSRKSLELKEERTKYAREFGELKREALEQSNRSAGLSITTWADIGKSAKETAPHLTGLVESLMEKCGTDRDNSIISTMAIQAMLHGGNQRASAAQLNIGLYMMAKCTNVQIISMLQKMGISLSYSYLLSYMKTYANGRRQEALREDQQWLFVYDNLNIMKRRSHVRSDCKNEMMNLTTRLAVGLRDVDGGLSKLPKGQRKDLSMDDFLPSEENQDLIEARMANYVKSILAKYFQSFAGTGEWVVKRQHMVPHKSKVISLELLDVDEKYNANNIEILHSLLRECPRNQREGDKCVVGDQATCRSIRGAKHLRSSESDMVEKLSWAKESPGDFHFLWECLKVIHLAMWGTPSTPSSLSRLRELSGRKVADKECKTFNHSDEFAAHAVEAAFIAAIQAILHLDSTADVYDWERSEQNFTNVATRIVQIVLAGVESADEQQDFTHKRGMSLLYWGFLYINLRESIRFENGEEIISMWRFWLVAFLGTKRTNYSVEAANLIANIEADWSPYVTHIHTHNRTVNVTGKEGGGKAVDMLLEHHNNVIKGICKGSGGRLTVQHAKDVSLAVDLFNDASSFCYASFDLHKSSKHTVRDAEADIRLMAQDLINTEVFKLIPSRGNKFVDPREGGMKKLLVDNWLDRIINCHSTDQHQHQHGEVEETFEVFTDDFFI